MAGKAFQKRIGPERRTLASNMLAVLKLGRRKARQYAAFGFDATPPATPTPLTRSASDLVSEIRGIHKEIQSLSSLAPGDKINGLLTRLVQLCIAPYGTEFTEQFFSIDGVDTLCHSLRILCANAEAELEKYWVRRILSSADTLQTKDILTTFPYYTNYLDLSRLESSLLSVYLPSKTSTLNIAFIGSGPLPLTSLCLLSVFPTAIIHNVDRDDASLEVSQDLTRRLGYQNSMTFACEDVSLPPKEGDTNWQDFDVVFLAALVGMDTESKFSILDSLASKLQVGTLVIARSARGLRGVLYPILELSEDLGKMGLEVLMEVHPWTSVVNSVVVLRVKEKA